MDRALIIEALEAQESLYLRMCFESGQAGLHDLCKQLFDWAEERRATLLSFRGNTEILTQEKINGTDQLP
jgi:hypothetical protein